MGRINLGQRAGITPTPMLLIGTYNDDGTPNAMVATWGVTATWEVVELNLYKVRKTTGNIKTRKAFTVSCVAKDTLAQCDYPATVSGRKCPSFQRNSPAIRRGCNIFASGCAGAENQLNPKNF